MTDIVLHSFPHSYLSRDEVIQFISQHFADIESQHLTFTDEITNILITQLRTDLTDFKHSKEATTTLNQADKALAEADKERDLALSGMLTTIDPYKHSQDTEEKAAYQLLKSIFDRYRQIAHRNYAAETTEINFFLDELNERTAKSALTLLGIYRPLNRLKNSQAKFLELYNKHSLDSAKTANNRNAVQIRRDMIETYNDLSRVVKAYAKYTKQKAYKDLFGIINANRKHYADIIHQRNGRRAKTKGVKTTETLGGGTTSATSLDSNT